MQKKKKIIIICSMVILLIATAYVNILLNNRDNEPVLGDDGDTTPVSHFASYRQSRIETRNEQFSYLDSIINAETTTEEAKAAAEALKLEYLETMELELVLEGLIKSLGFSEAIVTTTADSINVVADCSEFTSQQVSQILSIILSETSYTPDQVVVWPFNTSTTAE